MALGKLWAGRIFGTNVGNVFIKLEGEDDALTGTARVADNNFGVVVYDLKAAFDGETFKATGEAVKVPENVQAGSLTVVGRLDAKGSINGEWETTLGTGGTVLLFPHDQSLPEPAAGAEDAGPEADQLHTARASFRIVVVDKDDLVRLGQKMENEFPGRKVIVTIRGATEQSRFLEDFARSAPAFPKADFAKLFVQRPEGGGVNRTLTVELGPQTNYVMAQSADESWALGMVERLKRDVHLFERSTAMNIRRVGFGVNQLLLFAALVMMPDIARWWWRAAFLAAVIVVNYANNWVNTRYVPLATIQLAETEPTMLARFGPSALSWLSAIVSGVAVAILSALAQGWLHLP